MAEVDRILRTHGLVKEHDIPLVSSTVLLAAQEAASGRLDCTDARQTDIAKILSAVQELVQKSGADPAQAEIMLSEIVAI